MLSYIGQYSAEAMGEYSQWIQPQEILSSERERPISPVRRGGPDDYFRIQYQFSTLYSDWARHGGYDLLGDSHTPKLRFDETPCVVYADQFWIFDQEYDSGVYSFQREGGFPIPLAGSFKLYLSPDEGNVQPVFKLYTRRAYAAIKSIGSKHAPLILADQSIGPWLSRKLGAANDFSPPGLLPQFSFNVEKVDPQLLRVGISEPLSTFRRFWHLYEA